MENQENVKGFLGKYALLQDVGRGNFSKVSLAIDTESGRKVAIKTVITNKKDTKQSDSVQNEIKIQSKLLHPNIVRLLEVIETQTAINLVMEYCPGGELFSKNAQSLSNDLAKIKVHGRMDEYSACLVFRQILSALNYSHRHFIIHRDLKLENILLDSKGNVKIADWGLSTIFSYNSKIESSCGSPPYAAPELHLGIPYVGPEVDIWSLGVVLYAMVSGILPFKGETSRSVKTSILHNDFYVPYFLSKHCEDLIRKIFVLDPIKRISLQDIIRHPWVAHLSKPIQSRSTLKRSISCKS